MLHIDDQPAYIHHLTSAIVVLTSNNNDAEYKSNQ